MTGTKHPCIFCHKTTGTANRINAGSKGALQCDLWAHYECTGLAQATIDALVLRVSSGECDKPVKCSSCKAALNKFNSDLEYNKNFLS